MPPGTHRWALLLRPFAHPSALHAVPALPADWRALADGASLAGAPPFEPLRLATRCWVRLSSLRRSGDAFLLGALLVVLLACVLATGHVGLVGTLSRD